MQKMIYKDKASYGSSPPCSAIHIYEYVSLELISTICFSRNFASLTHTYKHTDTDKKPVPVNHGSRKDPKRTLIAPVRERQRKRERKKEREKERERVRKRETQGEREKEKESTDPNRTLIAAARER